jgi:colicin import membrane protein
MVNLNYHKILNACKKQIDKNPNLSKAIFVHVAIIVVLYILSLASLLKFDSSDITAQVSVPRKMQVIQATSISSAALDKQIWAYDNNRQAVVQARKDIKKAKDKAIQEEKKRAIQEKKRKADDIRKAKAAAKKKLRVDNARKAKAAADKKKLDIQKKKKAEVDRKQKIKDRAVAKKKAADRAIAARIAKAKADARAADKAEAQEAARKQIAQSQAQSAISSYISKYQDLVGQNWIRDNCRGIYDDDLPRAIIRNGRFVKLTGTSGDFKCDMSLITAIKNTQSPYISNSSARQTVQSENISFIFTQNQ